MEKVVMTGSLESSPRSTLGWKDYSWDDYEGGRFSPTRSKVVRRSATDNPHGSRTLPPQPRRQFRLGRSCGSLLDPESANATEGRPGAPLAEKPCRNSPPTPTFESFGGLQLGADARGRQGRPSGLLKTIRETTWREDSPVKDSPLRPSWSGNSSGCPSGRDDDYSNSVGTSREDTSSSVGSLGSTSAAAAGPAGQDALPRNRMQFTSSITDDLNSIRSCVKRAIDLGIKVQHYDFLEVSRLRQDKAIAEEAGLKWVELNRALEQEVSILRAEVQKVQRERELEVLAFNKKIRELELERNTWMEAQRDETRRREKLQRETDCVLSLLIEEKMNLESERAAHDTALRNERKKVQRVRKERDAAVKALQDGTQKFDTERDAMVIAMRDLNLRLDFERDAKQNSMRRASLDMATTMTRKNSLTQSYGGDAPFSRPGSRRNSRQF